jgi:small subunit ribosomal protein S6
MDKISAREYELTVLLHPDLESNLDASLAKVRKIIADNGGKIVTEDNWGKKKLAYPIRRESFAVYIYCTVELPPEANLKISNVFNITDEILRYLLVSVDQKAKKLAEKNAEDEAQADKEKTDGADDKDKEGDK